MVLQRDDVEREASEWVWIPPGHRAVRAAGLSAIVGPGPELVIFGAESADSNAAWNSAVELASEHGKSIVRWAVTDREEEVERLLLDRQAVVVESTEILAIELPARLDVPPEVSVRVANDARALRDADAVAAAVWGTARPSEEEFQRSLVDAGKPPRATGGFRVVAYIDGEAASTGGVTLAGATARLWGACTEDRFRRRGAYRACVALRLQESAAVGCSMALVNGRTETSAPTLVRLGFQHFGQKRTYQVTIVQ